MKYFALLLAGVPALLGQAVSGTIQGQVLDAQTRKPVPAVWVTGMRAGSAPFTRHTKSGGDGAFVIPALTAGSYSLCVEAANELYLDPCLWNASSTIVTVVSGQSVTGIAVKLTAASVLNIQVQDVQKTLSQLTKDGRHPDLALGVWGPNGLYYPAHAAGADASLPGGIATYRYRLAVPRDTPLQLSIASRDLKLGDAAGVALPANASQQAFQHAAGDPNPKSFAFTVLGVLP